jgi:hypothetical protein
VAVNVTGNVNSRGLVHVSMGRFRPAPRILAAAEGAETALGKIEALVDLMAEDLARRRAAVRFMAQFDAIYAREWPAERPIALEARISERGFAEFRKLIRPGIADGSLRRLATLGDRVELVLDEPLDTWKASKVKYDYGRDFDQRWWRDLSAMVMRNRNHPSVMICGIGNEIREVEGAGCADGG